VIPSGSKFHCLKKNFVDTVKYFIKYSAVLLLKGITKKICNLYLRIVCA